MKVLHTPLSREDARALRCGESCLITGTIYTARDAAHKRLCELAAKGKPLPFDIEGAIIYFVGPTPAKPGQVIGSAGPTTSYRMDPYTPPLLALALAGGGAALYYFKFRKPKADTTGHDDLDEYDFGEDEDADEEPAEIEIHSEDGQEDET